MDENTEAALRNEPIENIEPNDNTLPIEAQDPRLPTESNDPSEAMLR